MKKLILLLVFASFSSCLFAYPISPRPLRKLIIESEYIAWAYVVDVGSIKVTKKNADIWERDFAVIVIEEVLQGNIQSDTIRVYFCLGMICPFPGVLYKGEKALVFLDKREKKDGYEVHALSYGVKHGLSEEEYGIYKSRIREMQEILKTQNNKNCTDLVVDWLVRCAEQKCTRWEGVYELSPESNFMSYYDRDGTVRRDIFLSSDQRRKLFDVLMAIDTVSYSDMGLADISRGINDSVLLVFLKSRLARMNEDYFWEAKGIMRRIADLTDDNDLNDILKRADGLHLVYTDEEKREIKRIMSDFISRMKDKDLKQKIVGFGDDNI